MAGNMKPGPFQDLIAEAIELGIDVTGYDSSPGSVDRLRAYMARKTAELTTAAVAQERLKKAAEEAEEEAELEANSIRSAFDETMADTRGVLVRLVEWTEWLPVAADENEPRLTVANGVTGLEAGKSEKVLTVEAMGTQRIKHVEEDGLTRRFMLYAFKATLAQNVHTSLIPSLVNAQGGNEEGEVQKPSQIALPGDMPMPGPNRNQRRHPNG